MSRCTMPAACAAASACASWAPMRATQSTSAAPPDERGERLPVDELHRQESPVADLADLVDGDDVRVVERRGGARFLLEAAA